MDVKCKFTSADILLFVHGRISVPRAAPGLQQVLDAYFLGKRQPVSIISLTSSHPANSFNTCNDFPDQSFQCLSSLLCNLRIR